MFERMTELARQVVVVAQEEARSFGHNYIGTEHILLGLINVEGLASKALAHFDVDAEQISKMMVSGIGKGEKPYSGQLPFTPKAKCILELALREALSLGSNYIGTEHVLLGLLKLDDTQFDDITALEMLDVLCVGKEELQSTLINVMEGKPLEPRAGTRKALQNQLEAAISRRDKETKKIRKVRARLRKIEEEEES